MNSFFCDSGLNQTEVSDAMDSTDKSLANEQSEIVSLLYQTYRQDLLLHLQSIVKDRDVAEELLHDTFIRLSNMPAFNVIKKTRPFLITIARNLALDYLRQQKKRLVVEIDEGGLDIAAQLPEHLEMLVYERRKEQLKQAITDLPPRAKEALLLAKFKEMTLREVAKEMGISQTMVEKHLKTAIQKCRVAFGSETH
jgi:RNA polymerase sigma-70 factor (ECF subfamily)